LKSYSSTCDVNKDYIEAKGAAKHRSYYRIEDQMNAPAKETVKKMRQHLGSSTKLQHKTRSRRATISNNKRYNVEPNSNVVGLSTKMKKVEVPRISLNQVNERHQKDATRKRD
jgi:hypothetical protein